MRVSLVASIGKNRELGRKGDLIWRIKEDLQNFKSITMGHHILMGRNTWESIGRALPGRTSMVLSRQSLSLPEGVFRVGSVEEAMALASSRGETDLFVIGGGDVYRQALPLAQCLYLTLIPESCADADAFFPEIGPEWEEVHSMGLGASGAIQITLRAKSAGQSQEMN